MQKEHIEDIIAREILGEQLSSEELNALSEWLNQSSEHREYYAAIKTALFSTKRYQTYKNIDADKAYRQFLKIQEKPARKNQFWKYSAACLIPIFIIGGTIMFQMQKEENQHMAIVPGSTQATLQLADGQIISYDEQKLAEASTQPSSQSTITCKRKQNKTT